jgi:pantoate--beta-alanine ligase
MRGRNAWRQGQARGEDGMTEVLRTIAQMRERVAEARRRGARVGLVPTMGALHEGHASLIRAARAENGFVVVSLFINPAQFIAGEDFQTYPRRLAADRETCGRAGAHLIFAPSVRQMYPDGFATRIHVPGMSEKMCGAFRPGHFDGVSTVVAKLLAIVQADAAYFGEKDAQQLAIVRRMVADLNLPTAIRACPLVRDPDGLALSSRNEYLSREERGRALVLSRALLEARQAILAGERNAGRLVEQTRRRIGAQEGVELQYAVAVDPDTLEDLATIRDKVLLAVAAKVGATRLIDNILLRELG